MGSSLFIDISTHSNSAPLISRIILIPSTEEETSGESVTVVWMKRTVHTQSCIFYGYGEPDGHQESTLSSTILG